MATDNRSNGSDINLAIQQILLETQHRWLRPTEICEILQNHHKFHIASEPSHMPPSGSVFLFDRKVSRYFRKDGHSWRKKKDGKTVKEAHEKLKVGSVDMLHCYYAHGEENEYFQRRSYWLLEQNLMHIVFVHYLDVKGNKTNISRISNADKAVSTFPNGSPVFVTSSTKHRTASSTYTDSTSPTSTLTSTCEDVDSEENHQASSRFRSFLGAGLLDNSILVKKLDTSPYDGDEVLGQVTTGEILKPEMRNSQPVEASFQFPVADHTSHPDRLHVDQSLCLNSANYIGCGVFGTNFTSGSLPPGLIYGCHDDQCASPPGQHSIQKHHSNAEPEDMVKSSLDTDRTTDDGNCPFIVEQRLSDRFHMDGGLKKADSFSRWMSKELGEVQEIHMQVRDDIPWSVTESGDVVANCALPTQLTLETGFLNPSISQDQIFSIIDFSPNWAYAKLSTKVLITGKFLKCKQDIANCKLSCMFGEVEVPAEVLTDGVLRCHAPPHSPGRVPFYVSCSNRLACSEVREFEYKTGTVEADNISGSTDEMLICTRLERLLSVGLSDRLSEVVEQKQDLVCQIRSVMEEEEADQIMNTMPENDLYQHNFTIKLHEKQLKEKFYSWLLCKAAEDGKGPSVLDEEGQGVLHLAAALGYNWALRPTIVSGVGVDFRDVNGWTALHWAASSGREDTVAILVSLGAAPGALADPSPQFPLGRTPADLASGNGYKGISGFLAESSLSTYLSVLTVSDQTEDNTSEVPGINAVQTVVERTATPSAAGDVADELSLKDSLAAVRNATQAASRIHQIFRMQSFDRKKQFIDQKTEYFEPSHERALSLVASRTSRLSKTDGTAHFSAICIQKKYRGWKKRQEFLITRQRIVKIQAHVRGHQVRKSYKGITWSVGIVEKVILRWRRKGSGLRGFRPVETVKVPDSQEFPPGEDEYDFLKQGRKQNELRLQKALARVKSMVHYPEGRAQYRRLLTVAEEIREPKQECEMMLNCSEDTVYEENDMIDLSELFDDDTFMSIAFD